MCVILVFNIIHVSEKLPTYIYGLKDQLQVHAFLCYRISLEESISCFENQLSRLEMVSILLQL